MSDYMQTASTTEKKLEKLYLTLTGIALSTAIIFCTIIFVNLGFSSFTIMQAIGSILFIMFITSVILYLKKKSIYQNVLQTLSQTSDSDNSSKINDSSDDNHKTLFFQFLNEHLTDFELTQNLFHSFDKKL